ncbi:hypothetical protein N658DRAFT_470418 [Parathielavia hyrcaniae]|uniref:Rhodopsin domain-containing protein n=1 Tax=Parathielavia hyrcaniae TaxID=113614 RepID=A0AAN6T2T3_9PEZI|nr:hypothetical protein N658DRAFT_470418 [Parathielavia hyrcaniae]
MVDPAADLSRGPVLLSFSLATASVALATTFARFYLRRGIIGGFGADDYTSGAATALALSGTILSILESSASDPKRALQFNVIGQPWPLLSATLSKISICLFFMGLWRRARRWRLLMAGLMVAMAAISIVSVPVLFLQCRPLEKAWNPAVAGHCAGSSTQVNFGYAHGGRSSLWTNPLKTDSLKTPQPFRCFSGSFSLCFQSSSSETSPAASQRGHYTRLSP